MAALGRARGALAPVWFLLVLGCPSVGLVPRGTSPPGENGRFAVVEGRAGRLQLAVSDRLWPAPPHRVLQAHTPIWVELINLSDRAIRFRPEDFALEVGGTAVPADPPESLVRRGATGSVEETRYARTHGLRPTTLPPGAAVRGFLFFRRRFSAADGHVLLRAKVYEEHHREVMDEAEVVLTPERPDRSAGAGQTMVQPPSTTSVCPVT